MKNNNLILYAAILIFGVFAPFILPAFKVQLSILCILIVIIISIIVFFISKKNLVYPTVLSAILLSLLNSY